jgi:hypothetical protein
MLGSSHQRCRGTRARAEVPEHRIRDGCVSLDPTTREIEPPGQQLDVEDVATVPRLDFGQQIEQQRADAGVLQHPGNQLVAGAMTAAAAAMRKNHDGAAASRQDERSGQGDVRTPDQHLADDRLGLRRHGIAS